MSRYDTYRSNAAEAPIMRRWVAWALVVSLLFHAALFGFFYIKKLENFGFAEMEQLAPPVRVFKRVSIPKMPDEDLRLTIPERTPNIAKLQLPKETPNAQDFRAAPQNPDLPKTIPNDRPTANISDAIARVEAASRGAMERELNSIAGGLLKEGPSSPRQPVIVVPMGAKPGEGGAAELEGIPGRQSIDEALSGTGRAADLSKPIGIPGGALFGHDSAELGEQSLAMLMKIKELTEKYPKAYFIVSGHADATGTRDYNARLSQKRAEAVKLWLLDNSTITADRIETIGKGADELIVPADKSIEEQQPNRRVEIVVKTNRK